MVKIILVRHGETEWNRQEIFRGRLDIPLNKNGIRQARAVAQALKRIPIDAIYTSPLRRARETARAIAKSQGLITRPHRTFIDINFGQWQGQTHETIKHKYQQLYTQWQQQPHKVRFPNGESLPSVKQRTLKSLLTLCRQHPDDNIAIVSHRVVNKVILCAVLGLDNSHFWRIKQDTATINIFNYTRREFDIERLNDTCHLNVATATRESPCQSGAKSRPKREGLPRQVIDF